MSSTPPRRTASSSSSGNQSPRRSSSSNMGTLPRSRSSIIRNKNLSTDEGTALSDLHKKADKQLEDERRKEAEAMKYWDEMKKQEQQKFSDEENDAGPVLNSSSRLRLSVDDSDYGRGGSRLSVKNTIHRPSSAQGFSDRDKEGEGGVSNGLEAVRVWQDKFQEVESRYKESMVSNAQLYNEKAALIYQVETLKDRLEDYDQEMVELRAEVQRTHSEALRLSHRGDTQASEIEALKRQIQFRDEFLERHGLHLPTGEEDEEEEQAKAKRAEISSEEREELMKQITDLREELSSIRSNSLLGDQQPKDIVQVSTRMVSEYKTKLQIAEAENSRLEGTVKRLTGQVTRYKNQVKELEEREDSLMKEKRQQGKEIRSLQSESEDFKTEIDLLKRRIEQLRKRRDYGGDS